MKRRAFVATPLLLLASQARGADDFPEVVTGRPLRFPQDYGAHPDFRNEWWYLTGWLEDGSGHASGFQVTFFRNRTRVAEASPSRFAPHQLLFAHAAIADPRQGRLRHAQRAARAGFDLASALEGTTHVWIGDWSLQLLEGSYRAQIEAPDFRLDLRFTPTQPVLLQGDAGLSRKGPSPRQASYYYSQPQVGVAGQVTTAGHEARVTGIAWLDHEWSSEYLAADAIGWDWTGVNLDDGGTLMAFRMRQRSTGALWAGGSRRTRDGRVRNLAPDEIQFTPQRRWRSPRTQIDYPVAMSVRAGDLQCVLEPLMDDQELDARAGTGVIYWEGAVRAVRAEREIGRGYLELTGYGKPLKL